jgi:septum formation protein
MLILASASPRRVELLRSAGIEPQVIPAAIDETHDPAVDPILHAKRLAREKAATIAARNPSATVIGADTIVIVSGQLLEKPRDADDARRMLATLAGRGHEVVTAVHLHPPDGADWPAVALDVRTAVIFRPLADDEITWHTQSGDWEGKAGGYAIQGRAAGFVSAIAGSYTNVVGLPLAEVVTELRRVGALS